MHRPQDYPQPTTHNTSAPTPRQRSGRDDDTEEAATVTGPSVPTGRPYRPCRDSRFEYASEAVAEVERTSCSHGCTHAVDPRPDTPGGGCNILARVFTEQHQPMPELDDRGTTLVCLRRQKPTWLHEPEPEQPTATLWPDDAA